MALQVVTMKVPPNGTASYTFADPVGGYAIGMTGFKMLPAGGGSVAIQRLSQKFLSRLSSNTISVQWLAEMEPGGIDPASYAELAIFALSLADASYYGLATWEGVAQGQTSAPIQTVGTTLSVQETFLSGFHFQQNEDNDYVNTISVGGAANVSGTMVTMTPQLLLQDDSGHIAEVATMDAGFLQSCDPHPAFSAASGTSSGLPPLPFPQPFPPIGHYPRKIAVITGFSVTFGSGKDSQISAFEAWLRHLSPGSPWGEWDAGVALTGNSTVYGSLDYLELTWPDSSPSPS